MGTSRIEAVVEFDYVAQEPDELTLRKGDVITNIKTQPGGWWEGTLGNKRGMFPDNFVKVVSEPPDSRMSNDVALRPVKGRKCKVLFSYAPVNEDELELQVDDIIHVITEVEEGWWKGRLRDRVGVFPSNFVAEIEEKTVSSSPYINASTASPPTATTASGSTTTATTTASLSHEMKPAHREEASESEGELSTSVSSPDSSQLLDSTGRSDQDTDSPLLPPKPVKEICRVLFPYEAANDDELTLKEGDLITLLSREVQDKGWWKGELRGQIGVFPDNFVEVIQQEEQPRKSERPPAKTQTTTNRVRDSITKPVIPSGISKLDSTEAPQKKPPEVAAARSEGKISPVPPIPGKKPQLPPPIKKPQRLGSLFQSSLRQESIEQRTVDRVDGGSSSKPSRSAHTVKDGVPEFDSIERSAMLVHPTASRAKAPRRRLPTSFGKQSEQAPVGMMNGNADIGHNEIENSHEDSDDKEESGSKSWASEKNKVPWLEELMQNQARKNVPGPRNFLSPRSPTPSQTSPKALSHSPDQMEKKVTPPSTKAKAEQAAMKNITTQEKQVAKSKKPSTENVVPVIMRHSSTTRTGSSIGGSSVQQRPFSMSAASSELHWFTSESASLTSSKSTSLSQSISGSTALLSAQTKAPEPSNVLSHDVEQRIEPPTTSSDGTISTKQLFELKERVGKLEQSLAEQKELFTKTVKEFMDKLNEEVARRKQIEQELDKLINLVTQV
ncbi:CD2-associated protein isoform X1 [Schistocerca nitens]|uniref:CD2-associated protein isoform X1 n=2 Tax=Schistocerca nitens TaxID=7011 RepID=UPI002117F71A|nr:CD2-associated protein isoform X1 [Schistocerca nitens]